MFVLLQKHMYMRMVSLCDLHLQGSVIHMPTSYMSLHATQFFMPAMTIMMNSLISPNSNLLMRRYADL